MQLFKEALDLLHRLGSVPENVIQDFKVLSEKAKAAAVEALDTEAMLGDIPDEFLDPIQVIESLIPQPSTSFIRCNNIFNHILFKHIWYY